MGDIISIPHPPSGHDPTGDECFVFFLLLKNEIAKIDTSLFTARAETLVPVLFNMLPILKQRRKTCYIVKQGKSIYWSSCRVDFSERRVKLCRRAQCFCERYKDDLSVSEPTSNSFFVKTLKANVDCFEHLRFQFHKYY